MFLLFVFIQCSLYSQDSSALEFIRLYNKFRVENNLATLEYSVELEEFAKERIIVVSAETGRCYRSCYDPDLFCNAMEGQHKKFIPMAEKHNKDSSKKYRVVTENSVMSQQFQCYKVITPNPQIVKKVGFFGKISNFFSSLFTSEDEAVSIDYTKEKKIEEFQFKIEYNPTKDADVPLHLFNIWVGSVGHKKAFLKKDITHYGFKYKRVIHDGNEWIEGKWIAGTIK